MVSVIITSTWGQAQCPPVSSGGGGEGDLKLRLWKEKKSTEGRYSDVLETLSPHRSEKGGCLCGCSGEGGVNGQYIGEFSVMVDLGLNSQNVIERPLGQAVSGHPCFASLQEAEVRASGVQSQLRLLKEMPHIASLVDMEVSLVSLD